MKNIWFWITLLIVLLAIYGTFGLVQHEYRVKNICPKLLGIPACYIVFICFVSALLAHVLPFQYSNYIYFIFTGVVTLIAVVGTTGELTGYLKCPRTSEGIPMCFISLGICLSLLTGKFLDLKYGA